jgi:GNAT superfamily N-acetyltransferase
MLAATTGDPRLNPRSMGFRLETYGRLDDEGEGLEDVTQAWTCTAVHETSPKPVKLGRARLRILDVREIWNQRKLAAMADVEGGDIHDLFCRDWMDKAVLTQGPPLHLLFLEQVFVKKEFRGNGLGPLIAGIAIERIYIPDGTYAVCFPAPFKDYVDTTKEQAIESLGRTWAKLGFEHLNDGVWGLDLQLPTFRDAFNKVTTDAFATLPDTWDD